MDTVGQSKLENFCDALIEAGWLAAVVVAPLYINVYSTRSIEPDKLGLIRSLAMMMAGAWLVKWLDQLLQPRRAQAPAFPTWLMLPLGLLVLVEFFSAVLAVAPRIAFLGSYPRPEGVLAILAYLVVFALLVQNLRTREQVNRLLFAVILPTVPVVLYGLVQRLGFDPLQWTGDNGQRVGATMGNPIFLGGYLLIPFALTLAKFLAEWRNRFAKIFYGIVLSLQIAGILFSASRGPFLGWVAGICFSVLLLTLYFRQTQWTYRFLAAGVLAGALLLIINLPGSPLGGMRAVPIMGRLASLMPAERDSASARLYYWQGVANLVAPHSPVQYPDGAPDAFAGLRLWLGYGPDSLYLVYNQFYPPQLAQFASYDTLLDRSHNETWDELAMVGVLGWLANQIILLWVVSVGLRALGFIANARQRNRLIALWFGLALASGVACVALGQAIYIGLAIPAGNLAAVAIYLLATHRRFVPAQFAHSAEAFLLMALIAGIFAHYVEIQFGPSVAVTRLLFWLSAGLVVALATRRIEANIAAEEPATAWQSVAPFAFIVTLVLVTFVNAFLKYTQGVVDVGVILANAFTAPMLSIVGVTLLAAMVGGWLALVPIFASPRERNLNLAGLIIIPLMITALYAMVLGWRLSTAAQLAAQNQVLAYAEQLALLPIVYLAGLFVLVIVVALACVVHHKARWFASIASAIAGVGVGIGVMYAIVFFNAQPIQADVFHKLGREYNDNEQFATAIPLYQRALTLAPAEDYYYMALGRVLLQQAQNAPTNSAALPLSDQSTPEQILKIDGARLAQLNRLDALYAAQAMLLRARALMPLFPNHTLNLARFYEPELPVNTDARARLAEIADNYYLQTTRISPNNATVWVEWANFLVTFRNAPDAALAKLDIARRLDAKFIDIYLAQGKAFAAKNDYAQAVDAYRQAIALQPASAEAHSKLAFVYYQQGSFGEAIEAYQKYIELAPSSPYVWEAHKNLALIYRQLGEYDHALNDAQTALQLAPEKAAAPLTEMVSQLRAQAGKNPTAR